MEAVGSYMRWPVISAIGIKLCATTAHYTLVLHLHRNLHTNSTNRCRMHPDIYITALYIQAHYTFVLHLHRNLHTNSTNRCCMHPYIYNNNSIYSNIYIFIYLYIYITTLRIQMGHMHALEQASASGRASCSLSAGRRGTIIAYSPLKQPLYSASHIAQPFDKETLALATHPTVIPYRD